MSDSRIISHEIDTASLQEVKALEIQRQQKLVKIQDYFGALATVGAKVDVTGIPTRIAEGGPSLDPRLSWYPADFLLRRDDEDNVIPWELRGAEIKTFHMSKGSPNIIFSGGNEYTYTEIPLLNILSLEVSEDLLT